MAIHRLGIFFDRQADGEDFDANEVRGEHDDGASTIGDIEVLLALNSCQRADAVRV